MISLKVSPSPPPPAVLSKSCSEGESGAGELIGHHKGLREKWDRHRQTALAAHGTPVCTQPWSLKQKLDSFWHDYFLLTFFCVVNVIKLTVMIYELWMKFANQEESSRNLRGWYLLLSQILAEAAQPLWDDKGFLAIFLFRNGSEGGHVILGPPKKMLSTAWFAIVQCRGPI